MAYVEPRTKTSHHAWEEASNTKINKTPDNAYLPVTSVRKRHAQARKEPVPRHLIPPVQD